MANSRVDLTVPLLAQAPPGQVANVYEDLLGLVASDGDAPEDDAQAFKERADEARQKYNLEQLIVVSLPSTDAESAPTKGAEQSLDRQVVVSQYGVHAVESDRFLSPRNKTSYKLDHTTLRPFDLRPYKENQHVEPLRTSLETSLTDYVNDRYGTGVVDVFAVPLARQAPAPVEVKEEEAVPEVEKADDAGDEEPESDPTAVNEDAEPVAETETEKVEEGAVEPEELDKVEGATETEANDAGEDEKGAEEEAPTEVVENSAAAVVPEEDKETDGETKLVIHLVANKYKLSNFWSGRWRSTYTLESSEASTIEAVCNVHIHYFEEGNVQLHTSKNEQLSVERGSSPEAHAKAIAKAIEQFEESYQKELFKQCTDLSEGAFRALRRQLPMTRQKIDWDKVLNYKLGNELSKQ